MTYVIAPKANVIIRCLIAFVLKISSVSTSPSHLFTRLCVRRYYNVTMDTC